MASVNLGVLFIVGIAIFGGITGAWLFERLHFPNVVGYIVIGLVFGSSGFGLIQPQDIARFDALNLFALGLIGFLVGGELQADTFRKYGKQFFVILFGEGLAAFAEKRAPRWKMPLSSISTAKCRTVRIRPNRITHS